jgi:hypothetical protein
VRNSGKRPTNKWNRTGPLGDTPKRIGMPDDKNLPSTFSIEYVRAWKNK